MSNIGRHRSCIVNFHDDSANKAYGYILGMAHGRGNITTAISKASTEKKESVMRDEYDLLYYLLRNSEIQKEALDWSKHDEEERGMVEDLIHEAYKDLQIKKAQNME